MKIVMLVWLALAVVPAGMHGIVACFGAKGDVSLGMAHERHCEGSAHAPHNGHTEFAADTDPDCCGDCIDVPLSSDIVSHLTKSVRREHLLGHTVFRAPSDACLVAGGSDPPAFDSAFAGRADPDPPTSLLAQRTVVLRI